MCRPSPTRALLNSSSSHLISLTRLRRQLLHHHPSVLSHRPHTTSQVLTHHLRTIFTSRIEKVHPRYLLLAVRPYLSILPSLLSARPVTRRCELLISGVPVYLQSTRVALTMSADNRIRSRLSQSLSPRTILSFRLRLRQMMELMLRLKSHILMLHRAAIFYQSIPMPRHAENGKSLISRFPIHHSWPSTSLWNVSSGNKKLS